MCHNFSFSRLVRRLIDHLVIRPLFFNFLVYGFLGGKNGSVGRKKIKIIFFSKGPSMSSCRKKYRYMEIVLKSDVLRNY